jgi:hypothetical protein
MRERAFQVFVRVTFVPVFVVWGTILFVTYCGWKVTGFVKKMWRRSHKKETP